MSRTFWKARAGTNLNKFTKSSETASSVILTNAPDSVTEAGTPFTAAAMNNIENRIENLNFQIQKTKISDKTQSIIQYSDISGTTISRIASDYDGNVYAITDGGSIYKQTGGEGIFESTGEASRNWSGIAFAKNGDAWACTDNDGIYSKLAGETSFTQQFSSTLDFSDICITENTDGTYIVYATRVSGYIYRKLPGETFIAMTGSDQKTWTTIAAGPDNTVYAFSIGSGNTYYRKRESDENFVSMSGLSSYGSDVTVGQDNILYFTYVSGDVYVSYDNGATVRLLISLGTSRTLIEVTKSGKFYSANSTTIYREVTENSITPRQNLLINSNFDFWQEATSLSSGTGLRRTSDGGATNSFGTTYTPSRQAFAVGQTSVPNGPKYYKRVVVSSVSGASNYCLEELQCEALEITSNNKISISVWLKADATKNISVEFAQSFGTGGSTSINSIGVKKQQITSSWARYSFTADMPSISGKTIGTTPGSISAIIWFDAGSDFNSRTDSLGQQSGTFDIAQAKLEVGSFATDWEPYNLADELVKCQRYCEKSYDIDVAPGTATPTGKEYAIAVSANENNPVLFQKPFQTIKAYIPTIVTYSPATGNINAIQNETGSSEITVSSNPVASQHSTGFPQLTGSSNTAGSIFSRQWIARAYL